MGELRWILSGLGLVALGAIWWWTARRSAQTPGNPHLLEPTAPPPAPIGAAAADADAAADAASAGWRPPASAARDWGVPPLEPLEIRTAEFEPVPLLDDEPIFSQGDPLDLTIDIDATDRVRQPEPAAVGQPPAGSEPAPVPGPMPAAPAAAENSDRLAAAPGPNASELQKIITVRVCGVGDARWPGSALMAALELNGLAYGRYQVYHRRHSDGRSIFCVASLVEPGTFDLQRMPEEEFRGVTLFAVLPGPLAPLSTVDALLAAARDLARELSGTVQDARGVPFSPQRVAALREEVARFQSQLT